MNDLDRLCWRCGAPGTLDREGRVLCGACRLLVIVGPWPGSSNRHPMEWYLTHCWRCEEAEVPAEDDLGLCRSCVRQMAGARRARRAS